MKQENCLIYLTKYFYFGRLIMLKWYNHVYFALLDTDISEGAQIFCYLNAHPTLGMDFYNIGWAYTL